MSNSIKLSPKHGVNPTISICFWCGKEKNEIALLGKIGGKKDLEAPKYSILDFEPCDMCKSNMDLGITIMEATSHPNSRCKVEIKQGVYPTGKYVVITEEAAKKIFGEYFKDGIVPKKIFLETTINWDEFININKGEN